jgi:hypothetical protein
MKAINSNSTPSIEYDYPLMTLDITAGVPGAPGTPTESASTSSSITISWTAPSNNGGSAINNYSVYMNDGNDGVVNLHG